MSSAKKKVKGFLRKGASFIGKGDIAGRLMDKVGIGRSNTLRQILHPAELGISNVANAYAEGGSKGALEAVKRGDLTDPGYWFHTKPGEGEVPDPGAPPSPENISAQAGTARARVRRMIYRAQGRRSTIRSQGLFGSFTGNQSQLLGS